MIVCDICGKRAEYFIKVDYLRTKDLTSFDLCEAHYNKVIEFIESQKEADKEKGEPDSSPEQNQPVQTKPAAADTKAVKQRGQPRRQKRSNG